MNFFVSSSQTVDSIDDFEIISITYVLIRSLDVVHKFLVGSVQMLNLSHSVKGEGVPKRGSDHHLLTYLHVLFKTPKSIRTSESH